jgi:hypothetical protein
VEVNDDRAPGLPARSYGARGLIAVGAIGSGQPEEVWLTCFPLGFAAAIFMRRSALER